MLAALPLLAVAFAVGILGRRTGMLPAETPHVLNKLILNVSLPALVLHAVHTLQFSRTLLLGAAMMWLEFGLAYALFFFSKKRLGLATAGALTLTAGLANTAYLGLPTIGGLLGPTALGPAVVVDQLGSFLVLSTAGIAVAAQASQRALSPLALVRRLVTFPPFIALGLALVTRPLSFPPALLALLARFGDLLTPLALISVGFQLELSRARSHLRELGLGLAYKLVLAPLVVLGVFTALGGRGLVREVVVLQSAMAPMVTGGILASEYGLEPDLAAAMVGVGIPLSFATIAVWALGLPRP